MLHSGAAHSSENLTVFFTKCQSQELFKCGNRCTPWYQQHERKRSFYSWSSTHPSMPLSKKRVRVLNMFFDYVWGYDWHDTAFVTNPTCQFNACQATERSNGSHALHNIIFTLTVEHRSLCENDTSWPICPIKDMFDTKEYSVSSNSTSTLARICDIIADISCSRVLDMKSKVTTCIIRKYPRVTWRYPET